uniref:Uncharacterized protein n=1 Tax=Manihot esculenta TaxID=3983 RepID=A0A2C9UKP2_MANES
MLLFKATWQRKLRPAASCWQELKTSKEQVRRRRALPPPPTLSCLADLLFLLHSYDSKSLSLSHRKVEDRDPYVLVLFLCFFVWL